MQELQLGQFKQTSGPQTQLQLQGMDLVSRLLGGGALPGYLNQLTTGISPEAIGEQASRLSRQYGAGFQNMGISDSGVAFRETARGIANELLFPVGQFNLGNLFNLLNLGVGGQAQIQQPIAAGQGILSNQLAGLRTINQTGNQNTTSTQGFGSMVVSPFMKGVGSAVGNWFAPM